MSIADAVRQICVTQQTYYRWRKLYGGMGREQLKRLKELEKENQLERPHGVVRSGPGFKVPSRTRHQRTQLVERSVSAAFGSLETALR